MKRLFIFIAMLLFLPFLVLADQRFETNTNFCHFAGDRADDGNEVYLSGCQNSLIPHDAGDGNGRLTDGTADVTQTYRLSEKAYPTWITTDLGGAVLLVPALLRGVDAERALYKSYRRAPNIPCVMVTSNYNAANDDQNETVYVTNDWNLSAQWLPIEDQNRPDIRSIHYHLACRNGVAQ